MSSALPWAILLLPFFAAVVIVLFTKSYRGLSSFISVVAVLGSFAVQLPRFHHRKHPVD